ncbi:MAG TPA: hypothetical protein PL193_10090 [Xanthobacteraceae bacterium]|nr:hypothetical protein [Xanthobacteraceae bacterium]
MILSKLKIICLLLGIVAGGLVGFVTKPPTAQVTIPGINLEIKTEAPQGELTNRQFNHIALCAMIGAIVGLGIGFVADRRG